MTKYLLFYIGLYVYEHKNDHFLVYNVIPFIIYPVSVSICSIQEGDIELNDKYLNYLMTFSRINTLDEIT